MNRLDNGIVLESDRSGGQRDLPAIPVAASRGDGGARRLEETLSRRDDRMERAASDGNVEARRMLCGWIKENGEPCGARATTGSDYCYWHDPATQAERESGLVRQERFAGSPILPDPDELRLDTIEDVRQMLKQMAVYLATAKRIEPRRATALNAVAANLLKAMEISDLQAELAQARHEIQRLRTQCEEHRLRHGATTSEDRSDDSTGGASFLAEPVELEEDAGEGILIT